MRHADAKHHSRGGDKKRGLSSRGRNEAAAAGQILRNRGIGLVLCSSATRTRETLECMNLGDVHAEFMDALYEGGTSSMVQRIREIDDEVEAILVIGHAPTVPKLASELSYRSSDHAEADQLRCWYPTATFSEFAVECSWSELADQLYQDDSTVTLQSVHRMRD